MAETLDWKTPTVPNRSRTYVYPDGARLTYENVTRYAIGKSGTHRLEYGEHGNKKVIVMPEFRAIKLDIDEWSF
jgi:hypothetical protein